MGQTSICIVEKRILCLDTVFFHLGLGKGFIWFYLGLTLDCFSYNFLKFLPQRYCTFNFSENKNIFNRYIKFLSSLIFSLIITFKIKITQKSKFISINNYQHNDK